MELEDFKVTDIEDIIDTYYSAVCESEIVKDTLGKKSGRQFDEEEIKEILEDSKCKNPYDVPFGIIASKYFEPNDVATKMKDIESKVSRLMKHMVVWSYMRNNQYSYELDYTLRAFLPIRSLTSSKYGKSVFMKWYDEHKEEMYQKGIQLAFNELYAYECYDDSHDKINKDEKLREYKFTDPIVWPIPDEFDIGKMTYDSLKEYLTKTIRDDDLLKLPLSRYSEKFKRSYLPSISNLDAFENVPYEVCKEIERVAKNVIMIYNQREYIYTKKPNHCIYEEE